MISQLVRALRERQDLGARFDILAQYGHLPPTAYSALHSILSGIANDKDKHANVVDGDTLRKEIDFRKHNKKRGDDRHRWQLEKRATGQQVRASISADNSRYDSLVRTFISRIPPGPEHGRMVLALAFEAFTIPEIAGLLGGEPDTRIKRRVEMLLTSLAADPLFDDLRLTGAIVTPGRPHKASGKPKGKPRPQVRLLDDAILAGFVWGLPLKEIAKALSRNSTEVESHIRTHFNHDDPKVRNEQIIELASIGRSTADIARLFRRSISEIEALLDT